MAVFKFDEVDQLVQESDNKINFLKLQDDGWYAKVRFMYGLNETFEGYTVHNVSDDPRKPKYVPCLRGLNQPLDTCPLCANGSKVVAQFFIPVYVISIVSNVRGVEQEQAVNQVMLFQRGATFKGVLQSVIRQTLNTQKPIVSSVFNLVRNGKAGDMKTSYTAEYVGTDNTTLDQLPERPQILGSYILPEVDYNTMMEKYVLGKEVSNTSGVSGMVQTQPVDIQPRTLNANMFSGNTVVTGANNTALNPNQVSTIPPSISSNNVPF